MRKSRYFENGLIAALAIVFCTTLLPTVAAADRDHGKKKHRDRDRKEVVVRVDGRVDHPRVHARVRYEAPRHRHERYCPPPPRYERRYPVSYRYERYPVRRWAPPPLPRHTRYYYDPYCGDNFVSLTLYYEHLRRHQHASFAWVMRIGSEEPLYACRHDRDHDRWVRWDEDEDDDWDDD